MQWHIKCIKYDSKDIWNVVLLNFLFIKEPWKTVFNIDNIKKCFLSSKSA